MMALVVPDRPVTADSTGRAGQVMVHHDGGPWYGDVGLPLIPPIAELFPSTRHWRKVKPCGTAAAWRRHQRRREPICDKCRTWRKRWDRKRKGR